jgi:sphinganine C4-monooxygenase
MNNASKSSSFFSAMTASMTKSSGDTMAEELRQLYSQLPTPNSYPFYHRQTMSLLSFVSDKYLSLLLPIAIYWLASLWYHFLDTAQFPFFEKYRLHEPQELKSRNRVSAKRVVVMVLLQQVVQTMVGLLVLEGEEISRLQVFQDHQANVTSIGVRVAKMIIGVAGLPTGIRILHLMGPNLANWLYWWGIPSLQFFWAL